MNDQRDSIQPNRYADKAGGYFGVRVGRGAGCNVSLPGGQPLFTHSAAAAAQTELHMWIALAVSGSQFD